MLTSASSNTTVTSLRASKQPDPWVSKWASWDPKWTPAARQALLKNGYEPIPLVGKRPVLDKWQSLRPTAEDIAAWEKRHPNATNTGVLSRLTPTIDIDVLDEKVANTIHGWVRELIPVSCPELAGSVYIPSVQSCFVAARLFQKPQLGNGLMKRALNIS
jgi:hypothetical protein